MLPSKYDFVWIFIATLHLQGCEKSNTEKRDLCYEGFRSHIGVVASVRFSPDGKHLCSTGSGDGTIKLWEVSSRKLVRTLLKLKLAGYVNEIAFSPDGKLIASSLNNDNVAKLYDIFSGKLVAEYVGHLAPVTSVSFSSGGEFLASGSLDNTIKLWDIKSTKALYSFDKHTHYINSVAFSKDGKLLAFGSYDKTVKHHHQRWWLELIHLEGAWYSN